MILKIIWNYHKGKKEIIGIRIRMIEIISRDVFDNNRDWNWIYLDKKERWIKRQFSSKFLLVIQHTYSGEFSISRITSETSLLKGYEAAPSYLLKCPPHPWDKFSILKKS